MTTKPAFAPGQHVYVRPILGVPRPRSEEGARIVRHEHRDLLSTPEWYYKLSTGLWYAESELRAEDFTNKVSDR